LYWASQATMCVSILVFFFECFAYNMIFLRRILPAVGKAHLVSVFRVLFNSVWILGLWSYHQAHWCDAGEVPERWYAFVRYMGESLPIAPARPEWQPASATLCKKCQAPRPERAHHCMLCGKCVLRMDHHCPWINNCVGLHNHKFFLLLGIYTWLASLVALGTSLPELVRLAGIAVGFESIDDLQGNSNSVRMWDVWAFLIYGLFAVLIALLLTSLLSTHVPLACRNMTTIEDFYENMPNPYEHGGRIGNLAQVFGEPGVDWIFPVQPCRPTSDGILYPPPKHLRADAFGKGSSRDFDALRLDEGSDFGVANRWALLHEEGADTESAWRIRYRVRSPDQMKSLHEDATNPLSGHFWACGRGDDRKRLYSNSVAQARAAARYA